MSKPEGQREMGSEGIEVSAVSSRTGGVVRASTLLVGGLLVVIAAVIVWLGLTGRLSDLRHASLPFRPYPPPGYAYNPFDPGNKDDLINVAEANTVKTDLLADGKAELSAFSTGDSSRLTDGVTGGALTKLQQVIADNNRAGITQVDDNHIDAIVVGRLPDPANPSIVRCVQEKGTGIITSYRKGSGESLDTRRIRFDSKFWMVKVGGQYLIADSLISSTYQ